MSGALKVETKTDSSRQEETVQRSNRETLPQATLPPLREVFRMLIIDDDSPRVELALKVVAASLPQEYEKALLETITIVSSAEEAITLLEEIKGEVTQHYDEVILDGDLDKSGNFTANSKAGEIYHKYLSAPIKNGEDLYVVRVSSCAPLLEGSQLGHAVVDSLDLHDTILERINERLAKGKVHPEWS